MPTYILHLHSLQIAVLTNILQWFTYFCLLLSVLNSEIPNESRTISLALIDGVLTSGMAVMVAANGVIFWLAMRVKIADMQDDYGEKAESMLVKAKVRVAAR